MTNTKLKIGPLADQTPVKLSISLPPALQADLEDYAAIYQRAYGQNAKVAELVPNMLQAFLASDGGFRRARKALTQHA